MRANDDFNNLNTLYIESVGLGANAEGEGLQRSIRTEIKSAEAKPVFKKECEGCVGSSDKCPECEDATSVKEILKTINNIVRKMYKSVEDDTDEVKLSKLKGIAQSLYEMSHAEGNDGNDESVNEPTEGGVPYGGKEA